MLDYTSKRILEKLFLTKCDLPTQLLSHCVVIKALCMSNVDIIIIKFKLCT